MQVLGQPWDTRTWQPEQALLWVLLLALQETIVTATSEHSLAISLTAQGNQRLQQYVSIYEQTLLSDANTTKMQPECAVPRVGCLCGVLMEQGAQGRYL